MPSARRQTSANWRATSASLAMMWIVVIVGVTAVSKRHKRDNTPIGNEIYEIRIFETAPPGTKATLNEAFDRVMREQKNCFAQLETAWDTDWIEFDSALLMFITTLDVPTTARTTQQAVLHLMCASNKMRSIHFSIHVTRRNRHPPKFVSDAVEFYAPVTLTLGAELGRLQVIDNDPIIYNSQVQLNILPSVARIGATGFSSSSRIPSLDVNSMVASNEVESHWTVLKNGSMIVSRPMTDLQLYRPYVIRVLAVDFGSPQLFSICNVTIVPVSVSQPRNVRVNVANTEYQIFEWDAPAFGIPERYRIVIRRVGTLLHSQEVEASETIILSRIRFPSGPDYTVTVTAIDVDGSSPSYPYPFILIHTKLECDGECASGGGLPLCYYGRFHKIEQYRDANGPHCLCYDGFSSPQCDVIESCPSERLLEPYGGVDWSFTPVNQSSSILCPYNSNDETVTRNCAWDTRLQMARWQNVSYNEVCKKQSSILVHLGVLANYAQRIDQTASGLRAVQRFLASVLRMPAFRSQVTSAHFDAKIAEHVTQVLDTMAAVNLSAVPGNTSDVSAGVVDYVLEFTRRVPVPFQLRSAEAGLQVRTWHWLGAIPAVEDNLSESSSELGDEFPTQFGRRCYIHLPTRRRQRGGALIVSNSARRGIQIVRVACLRATTILPRLDGRSPVLFSFVDIDNDDNEDNGAKLQSAEKSLEVQQGRIDVVKDAEIGPYKHLIPRQKIASGAKVLVALRPEPLVNAHGALPDVNYTCAIYDHSKFGWAITGITVLSRNFEDGFVLCESTYLGVFALLPESLFETKHVALWQILLAILPIATASFAVLCTLFLLLIAVLQRPHCPDPALVLFLLIFLVFHLLHLLVLLGPYTIDGATLTAIDRVAYLCLQYTLISTAALLMLLAAATHARIVDLEAGVRRIVSLCCRLISTLVLGVVMPIIMCMFAWLFNGHAYENVTSPEPYLRGLNWAFAVSFALPVVLFVGCATGYASYAYYYARVAWTPTTGVQHVTLLTSSTASPYSTTIADSGRQRILKDLANAALFLLVILALAFFSAIVFFQSESIKRNLLLAVLHLGVSAAVFIFTGLLYRIELKFPRYARGNHSGGARRLFASGVNGSGFFIGDSNGDKSNGNTQANSTAPLILSADETDVMQGHATRSLASVYKTAIEEQSHGKTKCQLRNGGITAPLSNVNGSSASDIERVYESRKSNYFTYDASHGRGGVYANHTSQLGAPIPRINREEDDGDSGRLTLSSPAPSSLHNATDILRIRDVNSEISGSPDSDVGTASSSCNNNNTSATTERGDYADIRRSSHFNVEGGSYRRNSCRAHTERYDSIQYDRLLSPTLQKKLYNTTATLAHSLYASELAAPAKWSNGAPYSLTYRTAAVQKQHLLPTSSRDDDKCGGDMDAVSPHASKMSLLKLNFLYGKEMEALKPPHVITIQTSRDDVLDTPFRQNIFESKNVFTSPSSPSPETLLNNNRDEHDINDDISGHPVVSVV